jgi:hypothetical protein
LGAPQEARQAIFQRLREESEAVQRAAAYDKRLKKDPALRQHARRRLRRSQITSVILNEGRRCLAGRLPRFILRKEVGIHKDYRAVVPVGHPLEADALAFLHAMRPNIMSVIEDQLHGHGIKFQLVLNAVLEKKEDDGDERETIIMAVNLNSTATAVLNPGDIADKLSEAQAEIMKKLEDFINRSGWSLRRCESLDIKTDEYRPFRGRSYFKTPEYIPPRTVINVMNNDNRCFE